MSEHTSYKRMAVIMAGGSGERFWPLSRRLRPKQLLRLTSDSDTMLTEAVTRLTPLVAPEHIHIVTGMHLLDAIRKAGVGVPDANIIGEPCKRNTSGALAYAAAHLMAQHDGDGTDLTLAVTTADHLIRDITRFHVAMERAMEIAESHQALVTLGVTPTRPETGYGYIQITEKPIAQAEGDKPIVHAVRAFHEKPSPDKADEFIESGNYFWNSGMFFWTVKAFLNELDQVRPVLAEAVRTMAAALREGETEKVANIFEELEDISIDYALMEHAGNVAMVRADFQWDDVGSWPALDRTFEQDSQGNVLIGEPVAVDCRDSIVYSDIDPAQMAVGVLGLDDMVVVVTEDAILVAPKERAQDVRKIVNQIKQKGLPHV